jgi:hypothetical protein
MEAIEANFTLFGLVLSYVVSGLDVKWSWWSTPNNTHWNSGALESPKKIIFYVNRMNGELWV